MAEFWNEPVDFERRDLRNGPGGARNRPDPSEGFEFLAVDASGASPGFDVCRGGSWCRTASPPSSRPADSAWSPSESRRPARGPADGATRWKEPFLTSASGDRVTLHYNGGLTVLALPEVVRPLHLQWIGSRLDKLSDQQWRHTFIAAGYLPADGDRYVCRLKQKVADCLRAGVSVAVAAR